MSRLNISALLCVCASLAACGGGGIEIEGGYTSNFGETVTITDTLYVSTSMFGTFSSTVVEFDNAANTAIFQVGAPSTYSTVQWTEPDSVGATAVCTTAFGLASVMAAQSSTQTADKTDLDGAGCGGFPWTRLTAVLPE